MENSMTGRSLPGPSGMAWRAIFCILCACVLVYAAVTLARKVLA